MQDRIADEKIDKYLETTKRALEKLKVAAPARSFNRKLAESFLEMARSYYADATHFRQKGDFVNAFACVNYWLDAGARIGLFDVSEDDRLFTLYE
jgi:hypothetical protein